MSDSDSSERKPLRRAHRDVDSFDDRAVEYEAGSLGRLHHEIAGRVIDLVLSAPTQPRRILDVGCGTGYLLRSLGEHLPDAERLAGIDPAPAMIQTALAKSTDPRLAFTLGSAELLPYEPDTFDLVIAATSFDHWRDQAAGLAQCHRVLTSGSTLLLIDLFSVWLSPTLVAGRRQKARTTRRATQLLAAAGFHEPTWHGRCFFLLNALTATKT